MTKLDKRFQKAVDLHRVGKFAEALEIFKKILPLDKKNPQLLFFIGSAYARLGEFNKAVDYLSKSLAINPNNIYATNNLSIALKEAKRFSEALEGFNKVILLNPKFSSAYINRGNVLKELRRFDESLRNYEKAIHLNPNDSEAYSAIGTVLGENKKLDEALPNFDKAILLNPDNAEIHYNRAVVLTELKRYDDALKSFDRAIELKSDYAEAYNYRGNCLFDQSRYDEAMISYAGAVAHKPDYDDAASALLYCRRIVCDWGSSPNSSELSEKIGLSKSSTPPFMLLSMDDSPLRQKLRATSYASQNFSDVPSSGTFVPEEGRDRLTVGYFSADFREHAVMHLLAGVLESHDETRFKLIAYSYGPVVDDYMQRRLRESFDEFRVLHNAGDDEIVHVARKDGIDIAVDLNGYTKGSRPAIFASRVAPVQINYLGYPGTMGADFIDYIVADKTVIPPEMKGHYSENVIYLPHCYQPNDNKRAVSDRIFSRSAEGLPEDAFVFCCFNNNYKISGDEFDIWMRLLRKVDNAVLWLLKDNVWAAKNLKMEAGKLGISPDRIIFAERMPLSEHLSRQKLADLFLDTFNYNAHTTASDALWVGLPVLTKAGLSFPSRVAASLLNALGVPELITETPLEYESKAFELATNKIKLTEAKEKITKNIGIMPLFDTKRYARYLEGAYEQAFNHWVSGHPAHDIFIDE